MIGPLVSEEFAGYENVVDVDLEGADPWEDDLLTSITIDEEVLLVLDLSVLD